MSQYSAGAKNRVKPWFELLPDKDRAVLREMVLDPSNTYSGIADLYQRSPSDIGYLAKKWGALPRRAAKSGGPSSAKSGGRTLTLTAVDAQLEALAKKQLELKAEEERLEALRVELSIRFERDGDYVLVYGVAETGSMCATADGWIRFLNAEGARKLREFIQVKKGGAA